MLQYLKAERRLCPRDQFQVQEFNNSVRCVKCSTCKRGYETDRRCTETHDTECRLCPPGTFNDVRGGTCQRCSICKPGQYRVRKCKSTRDVKCRKCQRGRFSSRKNVGACRVCSSCRAHERVVHKCTRKSNTVCGDCKKGLLDFEYFLLLVFKHILLA